MIQIIADPHATKTTIVGHGLQISERYELSSGIFLEPSTPKPNFEIASFGSRSFREYVAVVAGSDIATFSIEVHEETGAKLAVKAWNSLWLFYLLSLACSCPCFSLFAITSGNPDRYMAANRNMVFRAVPLIVTPRPEQLAWAKSNLAQFHQMITNATFSSAMRCFGNTHYLFDLDTRIMLLWSGIEGLLSVDGELNRRLALYAALLHDGTAEEKLAHFNEVKKTYAVRSRAVHGGRMNPQTLQAGYEASSKILVRLLRRCVEIGRVPSTEELDALAVSQTIR